MNSLSKRALDFLVDFFVIPGMMICVTIGIGWSNEKIALLEIVHTMLISWLVLVFSGILCYTLSRILGYEA